MKATHIRSFEIDRVRFHLTDRGDGTQQVTSIHPYDETEYHWALKSRTGTWRVYREGQLKANYPAGLTEEQVAARLLNRDREAHLTRTGGIW